jgi:hypothetical protein
MPDNAGLEVVKYTLELKGMNNVNVGSLAGFLVPGAAAARALSVQLAFARYIAVIRSIAVKRFLGHG